MKRPWHEASIKQLERAYTVLVAKLEGDNGTQGKLRRK
jgi:hypothetical protein